MAWAADNYAQNLAQKTKRKLALLIGINQYDAKNEWLPLNGCVNDVELQKQLLIHRFNFNSKDIVTLTDRQATRANIIDAIGEISSQVLPDDVVIVHFSGYGSRIKSQPSLVPVDGSFASANETVNDITLQTFILLLQAIATDKITCIIDAGYTSFGNPIIGNFRIRARPNHREWELSSAEIALQQEFQDRQEPRKSSGKSPEKSPEKSLVLLQAAINDRLCVDANWDGFSSGVFTYALTQQLWKMSSETSLYTVLGNVISTTDRLALLSKEPISLEKDEQAKQLKTLSSFNLVDTFGADTFGNNSNKSSDRSADALIKSVSGDRRSGEVWLGGIPITPLGYYGIGSVFTVLDDSTSNKSGSNRVSSEILNTIPKTVPDTVQVRSHNGITAKVEAMGVGQVLQAGTLLKEKIRVLQRNLKLNVALDLELTKIERVDATSAISALNNVISVNATEQYADCLFGFQASSYGLFSVGRTPILGAFGAVGESIGAAIRRLQPQLESLLAAKLIHLTANQDSSFLDLKVSLEAISSNPSRIKMVASQSTNSQDVDRQESSLFNKYLTVGDRLSCKLENLTGDLLYVIIFSFDPRGKVMTPSFVTSPYANDSNIPPHQSLIIPQPIAPFEWTVSAPQGLVDVQIIVSRSPLTQTLSLLDRFSRQTPTGLVNVTDPLEVAKAVLADLHTQNSTYPNISEDSWILDLKDWATMGFTYRVA